MAKERKYIVEDYTVTKKTWYGPADLVVKRVRDSFPSSSRTGWPENFGFSPLTAARTTELISYRENRRLSDGTIMGYSTTADQYLQIPSSESEAIKRAAMNKAISEFSDMKANMAATFAERQSTIDMITNRSMQAYYSLRALKRGDLSKAIRIINGGKDPRSKKAASLHLEWAYGWAPLVGDISTICSKEFPPNPEVMISESVTRRVSYNRGNMKTEGTHRSTCSFIARLDSPLTASAEKLGLINPALVAWELVPFSFIVDWFLPIGSYLDSLTTFAGYTVLDKCLSENQFLLMTNIDPDGYGRTKILRERLRQTSFDLKYRPVFKNPLSKAHAENALALIRVLRKD